MASCGQERKSVLDLLYDGTSRSAEQGSKSLIEPKLLTMLANKVQDGAGGLVSVLPQSSPQLLQE